MGPAVESKNQCDFLLFSRAGERKRRGDIDVDESEPDGDIDVRRR